MSRISSILRDAAASKHWLAGPLAGNAGVYGQTALAAFFINVLGLVSSFFIMTVYDRVIPNNAMSSLVALTIGVVFAHLFDFILKSLRGYFIDVAGQRLDAIVGASVFDNLMSMRMDARKGGAGQTASLVREFENLRDFFSSATLTAVIDLPFIFIFIGAVALVGGPVALIPLIGVLAALIAGLITQPLILRNTKSAMSEGHLKHSVLIEALSGLETVKSVAAGPMMRERWRSGVLRQARIATVGRFINQLAVNFAGFAQQAAQVGVVVVGVMLIGAQEMSMGALIASVILTGRAMAPLAQVAGLLGRVSGALSSYKALDDLMTARSEIDPARTYLRRGALGGAIEFRDASFSYPGQQARALDKVSFRIEQGERVAILGRNGSGKSTIIRLALGVYEPAEGQVLIDDTDLRQLHPSDLRAGLGAVLQDVCLFSGTIKENIALGLDGISDDDILEAARIAGVHDFVGATGAGYDQRLGERGEGLSGGQRQAIALARALASKPSTLLLDEPSAALDSMAEAEMIARLSRATEGRTLILVTHRLSMLQIVDRVIVLDHGRVAIDGPRDEVLRSMTAAPSNQIEAQRSDMATNVRALPTTTARTRAA
ncbi:MAG: type I secretion system permease/ATPase [Parvularculaceae bacterium]